MEEVLGIIGNSRAAGRPRSTRIHTVFQGGSYIPYPVEVMVGGATVFVLNVEHYRKNVTCRFRKSSASLI